MKKTKKIGIVFLIALLLYVIMTILFVSVFPRIYLANKYDTKMSDYKVYDYCPGNFHYDIDYWAVVWHDSYLVYKAKDENIEYEKQLNAELNKLRKSREKYMDMYTDDLISREELNEKIGGMRKEIERLQNELKMVSYHLTKGEQLEAILNSTFKQLEDITDVHEMTNAQLKRLINKIEVDKDGNVDIYLRLIGDLGLDETVLIEGDKNTEEKGTKKVPNSYNHT